MATDVWWLALVLASGCGISIPVADRDEAPPSSEPDVDAEPRLRSQLERRLTEAEEWLDRELVEAEEEGREFAEEHRPEIDAIRARIKSARETLKGVGEAVDEKVGPIVSDIERRIDELRSEEQDDEELGE